MSNETAGTDHRVGLVGVAALAAVAYFVLVGGTPAGDLSTPLRLSNGAIGMVVIALYLRRMPTASDLTDRLVLLAALTFLVTSVTSSFHRQSLDSALTVVAYAAAFYLGRRMLADPRLGRLTVALLALMSLVVALVFAGLWSLEWVSWLSLTGGSPWPPLRMDLPGGHFGHQHDVAVLSILLLPATWIGLDSRARRAAAAIALLAATALAVIGGSRNVWLAVGIATLVTFAVHRPAMTHARRYVTPVRLVALAAAGILMLAASLWLGLAQAVLTRVLSFAALGARGELWAGSLEVWLAQPLTGAGPGSFALALPLGSYFAENTFAPRHPDNGAVQLLLESGALGVVAVVVLTAAIVIGIRRSRMRMWQATWALAFFVAAAIGANPSDFGFLVVPAIVWASLAAPPRIAASVLHPAVSSRLYSVAAATLAVILLAAVAATSVATVAYASARSAVAAGDLPAAESHLGMAMALDPGLALYARERGSLRLLIGDAIAARDDLERAIRLSPTDDAAWRALALTLAATDSELAIRPSRSALAIRPLSFLNQLVHLQMTQAAGDQSAARESAIRLVMSSPGALADPSLAELLPAGLSRERLLSLAAERWEEIERRQGRPLPWVPAAWLVGLAHREELLPAAARPAHIERSLTALGLALSCRTSTALQVLAAAAEADTGQYWEARAIVEQLAGGDPRRALRLGALVSDEIDARTRRTTLVQDPLGNPLLDGWYYRRQAILHPAPPGWETVADPTALWLSDAGTALQTATGRQCRAISELSGSP